MKVFCLKLKNKPITTTAGELSKIDLLKFYQKFNIFVKKYKNSFNADNEVFHESWKAGTNHHGYANVFDKEIDRLALV